MIIYGQIGGNAQQFGGSLPDGYVLMKDGERPNDGGEYIASSEGYWTQALSPLEKTKKDKIEEINTIRNTKEQEGLEYLGVIFDNDDEAKKRINVAANTALIQKINEYPFFINWTLKDNTSIELDADKMIGILPVMTANSNTLHNKANEIKDLVKNAITIEEVIAITWK